MIAVLDRNRGLNMHEGHDMEDRWFSVDEIAAYLGIKADTVYKWIAEKQMPSHRMGRLWKFRREEVDDWVKSGGAVGSKKTPRKKKGVS